MEEQGLFDSDILIDYLQGLPEALTEIARYKDPSMSVVSWIEVLSGSRRETEIAAILSYLERFRIIFVDKAIAERAAALRRERRRLKLPDAVIWATAQALGCSLITRNSSDFPENDRGVLIPYRV